MTALAVGSPAELVAKDILLELAVAIGRRTLIKVSDPIAPDWQNADKPGNLLQLKVQGFDGTVGSIERTVKALLEPALFHLKQVDEGKAP